MTVFAVLSLSVDTAAAQDPENNCFTDAETQYAFFVVGTEIKLMQRELDACSLREMNRSQAVVACQDAAVTQGELLDHYRQQSVDCATLNEIHVREIKKLKRRARWRNVKRVAESLALGAAGFLIGRQL